MFKGSKFHEIIHLMPYHWYMKRHAIETKYFINELSYGSHSQQKILNVTPLKITKPNPIIYFHGGGWVMGTPALFIKNAAVFTAQGYEVFLVGYRKLLSHRSDEMISDVLNSFDYIKSIRKDSHFLLGGISAGAHLASFLSFQSTAKNLINGVFGCGTPIDLKNMPKSLILKKLTNNYNEDWVSYISPINYLSKKDSSSIPHLFFVGKHDGLIPYSTQKEAVTKIKAFHEVIEYDMTHIQLVEWAFINNEIRKKLLMFLNTVSK